MISLMLREGKMARWIWRYEVNMHRRHCYLC